MKMYANLHTHSTHSDGVYTPEELVKVAKAEGMVRWLSQTTILQLRTLSLKQLVKKRELSAFSE